MLERKIKIKIKIKAKFWFEVSMQCNGNFHTKYVGSDRNSTAKLQEMIGSSFTCFKENEPFLKREQNQYLNFFAKSTWHALNEQDNGFKNPQKEPNAY